MDEKYITALYNQLGGESKFGSFEAFKRVISTNKEYQKKFHSNFGEAKLGSFDAFSSLVSQAQPEVITPKKKEESMVSDSGVSSSGLPSTNIFREISKPVTEVIGKTPEQMAQEKEDKEFVAGLKMIPEPGMAMPEVKREEYLQKPLQQIEKKVEAKEFAAETEKKTPQFLKPSVEAIDNDFMSREAQVVISDLSRQYKDAGFEFSGSPGNSRLVKVKAPNGKQIEIYAQSPFFNNESEASQLRFFIKENSTSISPETVFKLQKEYEQGKQNFLTQKQIDDEKKRLNDDAVSLMNENKSFLAEGDVLKVFKNYIDSYPQANRNTPEYKRLVDEYNTKLGKYKIKANELDAKIKGIADRESNLNTAAGEYTKYKSRQGTFTGYMWNKFTDGIGSIAAQWSEFMADRYWNNVSLPLVLGREQYTDIFNMEAEAMYGKKKFLTNEEIKAVDDQIRDDYKKLQKTGKVERIGLDLSNERVTSDDIRKFFTENIGVSGTTKEFQERIDKEGNIVQRGLGGLAGSLPAMFGGSYLRIANMYMLTTDAVAKEMQDNPDFKDISENEKELIKGSIGVVGAALEEFGFRNMIQGKAVIGEITKRVLGRVGTNVTSSQLRATALDVIKEMSLKGGLRVIAGGLAEAETGALQQINEFAVKDIYNASRGKKMFDTPKTVSEYITKVADASATESMGGFAMSVPAAISAAYSKDGFQGLSDDAYKLFEEMSRDAKSREFFVIDLKNKINEGKVANADASKMLENYDKSAGLVQQIPDEITDVNDRKVAMDLLVERKRLEDKVQGKDPALAKPIQNKIDQINEQLTKLTEDAIQKQTQPTQEQIGIPAEISNLKDDELVKFVVTSLEDVPEEFRDKAKKVGGGEIETRKLIFGLPLGKKQMEKAPESYVYFLTGKEVKDYAIQKQTAGEVPVQQAPRVGEEVVQGEPEAGLEVTPEQIVTEEKPKEEVVTPEAEIKEEVVEEVPVEEKTPEQEADLLEELITGKKKEPVMTPKEETMTPKEEIMTPKEEEVIPEGKPEIPKIEEIEETDIEIKDTQTTPEETQKQIEEFDETKIPEQEKPKPGMVAELDINEINADPQRFQYKEVTDKETGVNEQFKDPKAPFTKELANVISVWIDPNDGKTYVINGHHRLDYAKRSGEKTMNVIYIDAKDASEARLKGAMQNIAEGQGTDMDAAKVFRETGMTVEQLQSRGINVKGAKAMNGLSLASLADSIFNLVVQGKLSQSIGIIIGSIIQDKNVQEQFYNVIKGKNLNNGTIKVMAEDIQAAKKEKVEDRQLSMFGGVDEQAAYQQRATFIASVRLLVAKAKNILGRVARSDDFLREYGNEIDRNASETGSRESAMALAVFDKLRNTSPEIRQMIDEGVERISKGENKNKVINETAKKIIEATPGILEGVTGQPVVGRGEVKEPSAKGKQGATTKEEGVITEKPKEEAVEETKNLLDVPVKPFKKAVDLLGDPRQDWMYEATERELEQSKKKDTMRGSQYYPKKITAIENAVKKGKFEKAVQEGRMSAQDAKQIIESAGLKVPKTIEDLLSKPEKKKGKKLSDAVRKFEIKGPGGLQSNIFGIPIAIWNSAVKTTAAAIDAGVAVAEALQKGANKIKDWISKNDPFNKLSDEKINNKILRQAFAGVIKTARENNVSEEGIRVYLKRNGLSDEQIDIVVKKREQKAPPTEKEVREKTTAKKVDVKEIKEIEQIVKLQEDAIKEGKKSVQEAVKEFIRLFNQSKVVTKLTRSDLNKIINLMEKVKDFDSLQKAVGKMYDIILKSNEDIIEVSEKKQKEQFIKEFKKGVREKRGDLNTKRKALAAAINDMVKKGTLTVRQANAIIKRVNLVNLDNPVMVERLINYAGNIFNDADYDTRMQEIRGLQSQVKKKNHTSMEGTVKDFISINPELIPDNRILEYIQALDDMNTRTPSYAKMNNMFDEVMSYKTEPEGFNAIKTFQQLMDKLESIALNEVKSVEDYINLIRDINAFKRKASQLLSNGDITQAQYDQAIENVGKDQKAVEKKYEKELTALKQGLINEIEKLRPKTNPNFTPEENALIEKYLEIGKDNLMKLAPEELYILNDLLQNIEDGQMDYYRFSDIVSKAYSKDAIDKTTEQLDKTKFDMALDKGKQLLSEFESSFWEGLLGMGRVTSGALQKFIVSPMMRAISSYEKFLQDSYNTFSKIKNKYGMNQNNMNKLGMLTTYLQEYMAQFDPSYKGTKDIGKRDWFKEILNDKDMKKQYPSEKLTMRRLFGKVVGRGKTQLESMKEIWDSLPKDKDGNVDPKAVYDSYMANDGKYFSKKEKAFFDEIMDWKKKNTTTKQKAANELKGNPFKEIPFHLLRSRYGEGAKQIAPKASGANGMVRIEAGTGKERKDQTVGPININFEELFINGVEQTARDYYLSTAIQDINNVMSGVASNLGKGKKTLVETITGTLSEALNYEFDKTESFAIFKRLLAARASMVLFDPERTARELIAGLLSYPIRAKTLSGYKDLFRGVKRMKELLDFTESPIRLRENISSALDISDGQIKKMNPLQKATLYLAGFPERTMMVTSWMPTFKSEFKNLTGNDFDMEAFRTDKAYKEKYGKAIREAAAVADAQTEKIIGTTTKAGQRREIRIAPEFLANLVGKRGTVAKNTVFGQVFGFFTNYPYREVTEFFNGFKEAAEVIRNNGISSTPQAAAQLSKPLGISLNVALYGYLASVSYAYWLMLLGDDDDEERGKQQLEELSTTKGIVEDFQGNAISLLASRYGVGSKALFQIGGTIAYGMTEDEERKNWIKKFMKGSMYVDPLPVEKATEYKGKEAVLASISSYVPQLVVAADRYIDLIEGAGDVSKLYTKIGERGIDALSKDEQGQVLAISSLFKASQLGLNLFGNSLPMYNKMKIYMKKLRTESGVAEKTAKSEKREAYGGYKTIEELEAADPKKYKELSKKGGALYKYRKEQKAERKVNKEEKAKELEEKYGVKPKSKSSSTRGGTRGGTRSNDRSGSR